MMQQIKQLGEQLLGIWKQLGLNQRVIVAAAGVGIFGALMGIAYWSGQSEYSLLYGNLSLKEADNIQSQLESRSIPYKIGNRGNSILVPSDQVHSARIYLAGKGLPSNSEKVGLEIFDRPSFGLSNMQQRVNHTRAIQGELAKTIARMDGVDAADVMVVMPENTLFIDEQSQASASVFLKTSGPATLGEEQVKAIQHFVANAVEGLGTEDVTVTNSRGELLSQEQGQDADAFLSDRQLESRRNLEAYLSRKAEEMLTIVLGPGNAIVRVSAEINRDTITTTDITYDEDPVARSSTETIETTTTQPPNPSLLSTNTPPIASTTGTTVNNTSTKDSEFAVGSRTNDTIQVPGGIKNVTAAVFVAKKEDKDSDGNVTYVTRDTAEMESIEQAVSLALGITNTVNNLTVEQFAFHRQEKVDYLNEFQKYNKYKTWISIGKQVGYLCLTLAVLYGFVRTFRKTPIETIPLGVPLDELGDFAEAGNGNRSSGAHKRSNFSIFEPGPPDERIELMNQLIRDNPQNMTHAIESWLQEDNGKSN